jgi:hypothetical protein
MPHWAEKGWKSGATVQKPWLKTVTGYVYVINGISLFHRCRTFWNSTSLSERWDINQ